MSSKVNTTPLEDVEQECLFRWIAFSVAKHPELKTVIHIPNEGKRSKREGAKLKRLGLRPGAPDIILPIANGKHNALFIELKRLEGGRVSPAQKEFLQTLTDFGAKAVVCFGWVEAAKVISDYLGFPFECI